MSNLAFAPSPAPKQQTARPAVEIVSTRAQRKARPKPIYALVTVGGLFALVLAQLLLSIVVADGAYQISALQVKQTQLERKEVSLTEQVDTLASTQNLASRAEELGMVMGTAAPAFLDASSGEIIGKSKTSPASASDVVGTNSLVPNSLLPEDQKPLAGTDAADADADAAADAAAAAATTETEGTNGFTTSGAPAGASGTGSVTSGTASTSGIPVPTR